MFGHPYFSHTLLTAWLCPDDPSTPFWARSTVGTWRPQKSTSSLCLPRLQVTLWLELWSNFGLVVLQQNGCEYPAFLTNVHVLEFKAADVGFHRTDKPAYASISSNVVGKPIRLCRHGNFLRSLPNPENLTFLSAAPPTFTLCSYRRWTPTLK